MCAFCKSALWTLPNHPFAELISKQNESKGRHPNNPRLPWHSPCSKDFLQEGHIGQADYKDNFTHKTKIQNYVPKENELWEAGVWYLNPCWSKESFLVLHTTTQPILVNRWIIIQLNIPWDHNSNEEGSLAFPEDIHLLCITEELATVVYDRLSSQFPVVEGSKNEITGWESIVKECEKVRNETSNSLWILISKRLEEYLNCSQPQIRIES